MVDVAMTDTTSVRFTSLLKKIVETIRMGTKKKREGVTLKYNKQIKPNASEEWN